MTNLRTLRNLNGQLPALTTKNVVEEEVDTCFCSSVPGLDHLLHGSEQLVFCDWDEEVYYVERVTIQDEETATKFVAREMGLNSKDVHLEEAFMKWETAPPGEPFVYGGYMFEAGWAECGEDDPAAVPFWRYSFWRYSPTKGSQEGKAEETKGRNSPLVDEKDQRQGSEDEHASDKDQPHCQEGPRHS